MRAEEIAKELDRCAANYPMPMHSNSAGACASIYRRSAELARATISKMIPVTPDAIYAELPRRLTVAPDGTLSGMLPCGHGAAGISNAYGSMPPHCRRCRTKPKTREAVLEEALRAIERCVPPGEPGTDPRDWSITRDGGERAAAVARRALDWKP